MVVADYAVRTGGFTGGSIWVDPGRGRILVLLAHRTSADVELAAQRRLFHRLAIDGKKSKWSKKARTTTPV